MNLNKIIIENVNTYIFLLNIFLINTIFNVIEKNHPFVLNYVL